jgi:uncharacterized protein YqjF (DUF2071 family)
VSSTALRPLVPDPLTIDEYDGSAYVSLTPVIVNGARPLGLPVALGLRFPETNVRTYVHVDGGPPAIYFLSLDAAFSADSSCLVRLGSW